MKCQYQHGYQHKRFKNLRRKQRDLQWVAKRFESLQAALANDFFTQNRDFLRFDTVNYKRRKSADPNCVARSALQVGFATESLSIGSQILQAE